MSKHQDHENPEGDFISPWLKMAANLWNVPTGENRQGQDPENGDLPPGDKSFQEWQNSLKNLTSFVKLMGKPENQKAFSNGLGTLLEMMMNLSGNSIENTIEFQEQFLKTLAMIGQRSKPYSFDDTEQNPFESFRTLYEQEFQKYLKIPQFGLPRFHQENVARLMDKFNIFNFNLSELAYLFSVPMERANRMMQEKMEGMLDKGDFFDDPSKAYDEWVKILEGHYMVLLKSNRYTLTLKNTINAMAEYRKARDEVMCQVLKALPIPTNREMDDVYKELYTVKRQLRKLSKEIAVLKEKGFS